MYVCQCMYVCMYACMHVCMHVGIHVSGADPGGGLGARPPIDLSKNWPNKY